MPREPRMKTGRTSLAGSGSDPPELAHFITTPFIYLHINYRAGYTSLELTLASIVVRCTCNQHGILLYERDNESIEAAHWQREAPCPE